ncbi:TolC family protein [Rhodovarius crocodyli]|uniref:TolC family protein n=1 Tax=Rhodovarius crocodyli TaxID=1979269 RepID=A0A437M227_9PROT|nr:TolC family protein [Rhodovarius crocodyli]RVT91603.1 TolC family protein [Rhodovarius crocodyli]
MSARLKLLAAVLLGCTALQAPAALAQNRPAAAAPGPQVLTIEAAERMLVERNLTVIAARRGVDAAQAQRLVASSLPPPQVTVGNTFANFQERQRGGLTGARFFGPTNNVNVGISMLVELGGKRELRTRLAQENIGVAEAQVLDALRTQLFALRQNFIAAMGARANLEVALANRSSLDNTENLLRRRLRDGAIPEGDLLRFQASRVVFEADVTTNAQAYAAAIANVAVALAADAADGRRLADVPQAPPRGRGQGVPTASIARVVPALPFDVQGAFNTVPDLGVTREQLAEAVQDRADVVAAARTAAAAGANRNLAEAGRWRDVSVNVGANRTRLSQDQPNAQVPITANNEFTVSLGIPIFTRRITEGNIGVATGQAAQAEAQARGALLQARADFATAWATYEQSRSLLRLYTGGALSRAEQAYRSAEQAYLAGGSSLLDVMDALRTLNTTRVATNQARQAYLTALAGLEQATGVSGISPTLR